MPPTSRSWRLSSGARTEAGAHWPGCVSSFREAMAHVGASAVRLRDVGFRVTNDGVVRGKGFAVTASELVEAFVGMLDW